MQCFLKTDNSNLRGNLESHFFPQFVQLHRRENKLLNNFKKLIRFKLIFFCVAFRNNAVLDLFSSVEENNKISVSAGCIQEQDSMLQVYCNK